MTRKQRNVRVPLHYAALENDADTVRHLAKAGADPNVADAEGFTPLHLAAQEKAVEAGRALLESGADVDSRNVYGNTPLFVAVFNSQGAGEFIRLLRDHGADPHAANGSGQTPVGLARLIANYDIGRFFEDV
jgi:uncharacterized protein